MPLAHSTRRREIKGKRDWYGLCTSIERTKTRIDHRTTKALHKNNEKISSTLEAARNM